MTSNELVIPVSDRDHITGSLDAPVILVEYGDFECPHCGRAYPIVKASQRALGDDLAVVYRHFPLAEIHPHARRAAQAAEAAQHVDVVWYTDHNWRENGVGAPTAVHFNSLTGERLGVNPPWTFVKKFFRLKGGLGGLLSAMCDFASFYWKK